jgi:hypothetical protein
MYTIVRWVFAAARMVHKMKEWATSYQQYARSAEDTREDGPVTFSSQRSRGEKQRSPFNVSGGATGAEPDERRILFSKSQIFLVLLPLGLVTYMQVSHSRCDVFVAH